MSDGAFVPLLDGTGKSSQHRTTSSIQYKRRRSAFQLTHLTCTIRDAADGADEMTERVFGRRVELILHRAKLSNLTLFWKS